MKAGRKLKLQPGPRSAVAKQQERLGRMLVFPSVLVVVFVTIYPLVASFRLSFTNLRARRLDRWRYIGVENYRDLFADSSFLKALWNPIVFTAASKRCSRKVW
jgi:multiple sugar transport system permease protein